MTWQPVDAVQGVGVGGVWAPVGTVRGPAGPPGPLGGGAYVHTQTAPASTWTIAHGLGRMPHAVTIYIGGKQVTTDTTVDETHVVVEFPSPESGEAHII